MEDGSGETCDGLGVSALAPGSTGWVEDMGKKPLALSGVNGSS